jgi:hypothetical protein
MNLIFDKLLHNGVLVFMDDILVYTPTLGSHIVMLHQVLEILKTHHLFIKRSNFLFAQPKLEYLRHVISGVGVATDPAKIAAVQDGLSLAI